MEYYSVTGPEDRGTELLEPDFLTPDQFAGLLRRRSWQDGERRLLVPFVDAFLVRVDVAARRIDLDLPPGLVDVCAST